MNYELYDTEKVVVFLVMLDSYNNNQWRCVVFYLGGAENFKIIAEFSVLKLSMLSFVFILFTKACGMILKPVLF